MGTSHFQYITCTLKSVLIVLLMTQKVWSRGTRGRERYENSQIRFVKTIKLNSLWLLLILSFEIFLVVEFWAPGSIAHEKKKRKRYLLNKQTRTKQWIYLYSNFVKTSWGALKLSLFELCFLKEVSLAFSFLQPCLHRMLSNCNSPQRTGYRWLN